MQLQSALQQYSIQSHMARAQAPTKMISVPSSGTDNEQPSDTVTLSPESREKSAAESQGPAAVSASPGTEDLSREELAALTKLQARDKEVRAHEQAHLAAAGGYATSGASFTLQKGPDGNSYAVGGEVGIDMSKEADPNATIEKMRAVKRAALAPASPSSVDRQIASQATARESQARQELVKEQEEMLKAATNDSQPKEDNPSTQKSPTVDGSPGMGSLKASIAAYERISAL